ncbi:MAG TPA: FAD-binding oxidoreductase [Bryobacteraceae bacterium]|jgi:FAD/FMN-containing dehydrogenase|nr:FAD-binding oxidoreductase [Bryobacteraceae bacterium]
MNRRTILKRLVALPFVPVLQSSGQNSVQSELSSFRRVRPSDPSWPTVASWEKLKAQVHGHLRSGKSVFTGCQSTSGGTGCQKLFKDLQNPYFIGDQPCGTQTVGWVDGWITAPSAYVVEAHTVSDVVAAVNFARDHRLRLVVKGGGHSYQGTSNAADSLLIWTRPMNRIALHDRFVPQGCSKQQAPCPAVTIEAGALWMDAYNAVTTIGQRYVQGGGCATVGVAGLIQSGGFGSFSKNFGTAAAGLLEAEVVTADGQVRTANACTDADLFWGIKGGGGGSLGVVTKVTLRTHELPPYFARVVGNIKASSDRSFRRLIGQFLDFYHESLLNPHWGESVAFGRDNTLGITMAFLGDEERQAQDTWKAFLGWVAAAPREFTFAPALRFDVIPARHYWDAAYLRKNFPGRIAADSRPGALPDHVWWSSTQGEVGIFIHGYESGWVPAALLESEKRQKLADALFASSRQWGLSLHFNKGLAGAPPDAITAARDTAMNPAVLDAFALAIIGAGEQGAYPGVTGREPNLTVARSEAAQVKRAMDEIRKLVPNPGSYVSEGNFSDSSWQLSYWGSNYPRLRAVKRKYDPQGLFFVHHGVGSEEWSADGFTRLPYKV